MKTPTRRSFFTALIAAFVTVAASPEVEARGRRSGGGGRRSRGSGGGSRGGCGSRGGPGYRKANGKCAGWND